MCIRYLLYENNGVSVFRERNCYQIASSEGACKKDPVGRYSTTYDGPQFQRYLEHLRQRRWRNGGRCNRLDFGQGWDEGWIQRPVQRQERTGDKERCRQCPHKLRKGGCEDIDYCPEWQSRPSTRYRHVGGGEKLGL